MNDYSKERMEDEVYMEPEEFRRKWEMDKVNDFNKIIGGLLETAMESSAEEAKLMIKDNGYEMHIGIFKEEEDEEQC